MPLNKSDEILADSSFFICFLDDIEQPKVLKRMLYKFDFLVTPMVYKEISKSINFKHVQNHPKIILVPKENLGESLRPFFSKKEVEKGETEVIELAYQFYSNSNPRIFIIDEDGPRLFVIQNLPYLEKLMIGTVGFVGECYYEYGILEKSEASAIILIIGTSKFRVSAEVIREVLTKIESR